MNNNDDNNSDDNGDESEDSVKNDNSNSYSDKNDYNDSDKNDNGDNDYSDKNDNSDNVQFLTEQTLKIIKETTVNKIQVGINSVKKVRNKSVVIELRSKEECEAFMKKVETNSQHLTARIPTKRNPEVIIHGIEAGIGNDDLIQCIMDQNPYIKHCLDSGEQMEIRFMKRSRDNTTQFAVLRVTPTIYHAMRNGGKVYIGYSRCPVKDHIPVTRCYTCCGYGHISKDCTFERHCRRCAEDHSFDICPQEKTEPNVTQNRVAGFGPGCNLYIGTGIRSDTNNERPRAAIITKYSHVLYLPQYCTPDLVLVCVNWCGIEIYICGVYCEPGRDLTVELNYLQRYCTPDRVVVCVDLFGQDIYVCNIYCDPDCDFTQILNELEAICSDLKGKHLLIVGDINAKHHAWNSPVSDSKGKQFFDFCCSHNLAILNTGNKPTFRRNNSTSFIDVSVCSHSLTPFIVEWKVSDFHTMSDRELIIIDIKLQPKLYTNAGSARIYKTNNVKWSRFQRAARLKLRRTSININNSNTPESLNSAIEQLTRNITELCEAHLPKKSQTAIKNYWWTAELNIMRKRVLASHRRYKRCKCETLRIKYEQFYNNIKTDYKNKILQAKTKAWKEFCSSQSPQNPWGIIYKMCRKPENFNRSLNTIQTDNGFTSNTYETASVLINKFFPDDSIDTDVHKRTRLESELSPDTEDEPQFTAEEVERAIKKLNDKKAPGIDAISANIIKNVHTSCADLFVRNQYGFTPQKSTEDAVLHVVNWANQTLRRRQFGLLISLDISGAFDNACNRKVQLTIGTTTLMKDVNKGCPQGSCCSPGLWNILYDDLLQMDLPNDCQLIAYADDALVLITADNINCIENKANETLTSISKWGKDNKLQFNPLKTKALLITRKRNYDLPHIQMDMKDIDIVETLLYLGVTLDKRMSFKAHIDSLVTKSHQFQSALHRATRPTWGLSPDILRTIYHGAFEPLILYCVSAFQNILHKKWVQNKLIQIQRGFILRITKAYRTTSTDAALVIAGIPPLFLTAMAKAEISNVKRNGIFIEQESYLEVEKRSHFQLTVHPKDFHRASNTCTDRHEYNIYTDGSRLQKENDVTLVGCAFVTYYNTTEVHSATFRLAPMCSVFQAELFAILQAVKWSITNGIDSCIHSDSQSALQTIDDKYNLHSIAVEIRSLILKFEGRICLMWVRGHTGTEGNERADTLAKQAASTNSEYKYSTCPISYIKQKIKHTTTLKWNTYWNSSVKGSVTKKLFFPNVQDRLCCSQFSTDFFYTQFMTGHGKFGSYFERFRIKSAEESLYICKENQTVEHLIFHCPCDSDVRFELTTSVPQESRSRGLHGALRDGARRREERGMGLRGEGDCARSCLGSEGGTDLPESSRGVRRSSSVRDDSRMDTRVELSRLQQASLVYRSSTRVCVRNCVSIRRPEFECSVPQLEGPEFECSGQQLEGPEFEYSGLSLKVCGSRYCELERRRIFCGPPEKELRKRLVKCFVWSVALYGEGTWTLRRNEEKRIEAFEMWMWRKTVRVKWTDRIRNKIMFEKVSEERMMLKLIRKIKSNWLGLWLKRIIDDIRICGSYAETKRKAENRKDWRLLGLQ
ncbi:hypothetical protein ANN_04964 [Periplaneta americana]|uniref:Uncharacterized protein n=1 Tax=Periplaneta americana TaxID=6978 RepID=A0ABQ8TBF9_PERAM|nr:hypothetical protein ANN_04964 [Periplaneta americana]